MNLIRQILTLAVSLLLVACASTLRVTYQSDPPGAALYSNSQMMGYTPLVLEYKVTEEDKKNGSKLLMGTTVRWASGASAQVSSLNADLKRFGFNQQFNFERPESYPGRATDMQFALELQKIAIMKQQARAQQDQAYWQMQNAINQQNKANQRTPTNCTSTAVGNTVQTSCY